MTKTHKNVADSFIRISSCISQMGTSEYMEIDRFLNKVLITGREIAPNTGTNATKFFTLVTKS